MVREEKEWATSQMRVVVLHPPHGGLHLQQERRVIGLMFLKTTTCVCDGVMFSFLVNLCENGPESSGLAIDT